MRRGNIDNNIDEEERLVVNNKENDKENDKIKVKLFMWLIITIFLFYQIYSMISYTLGNKEKEKMWLYNSVSSVVNVVYSHAPKQTEENYSLKFAALGDIYLSSNTLKGAKGTSSYDFSTGTDSISSELKKFDIVMASLATPVVDNSSYTSKDTYNAPNELLDTLKKLNISIVATATYHAMDKSENGIVATTTELKNKNIAQIGISSESRNNPIVITKNNITLGILSYTTSSQTKISDKKDYLVNVFNEKDLKKDIEYLKSKNVDYIISYLYSQNQDSKITTSKQKECVDILFKNGVNVVFGTGSNTVQNTEEDLITVNEKDSHVYIAYGLGDFIGSYETEENRLSTISSIEFTKTIKKDKKGQETSIETDMKVADLSGIWTKFSAKYIKSMYLVNSEIENYDNDKSNITSSDYLELKNAKEYLDEIAK